MSNIIIGLVGPISGGKSLAAEALQDAGFYSFSLSTVVRQYAARKRGCTYLGMMQDPSVYADLPREALREAGTSMREQHGGDILAKIMVEVIRGKRENGKLPPDAKIVIEGIRNPDELRCLIDTLGAYPIGVTAEQDERWHRTELRQRSGDPLAWKEFQKKDDEELRVHRILESLEICRNEGALINSTGKSIESTREEVLRIAGFPTVQEGRLFRGKESSY